MIQETHSSKYKGDASKAFVDMDSKLCTVYCALQSGTFVQDESILVRDL